MPLYGKGFDTLNHTQFMNIKTLEQTFKSHHIKGPLKFYLFDYTFHCNNYF